jgi:acetyl-CoA carboxylase biotin carboxylase subunit
MGSFSKVLVANRGEIAIRILRTAREMGLKTVAVYSEEDAQALHRFEADEAVCIGPADSRASYLNTEVLLAAAKSIGADAVHPGYGFLSENAPFAKACVKAGLTFIGPSPSIIETMGDKVTARKTVEAFGVPTTPGTGALSSVEEGVQTVEALLNARPDFQYPLLIKAAGGGGGKGMRIVREPKDLADQIARAQSEALKAFNNPVVFVERYLERPRHLEVQVLGDGKKVLHLFERECSLQRRHQKVVEEAPSPSITPEVRARLLEAGVKAAQAVNYVSAGTVEFIVSENDDIYFLEMNTRIQVEHPVSEWITGFDLIRAQIEIAQGKELKLEQSDIHAQGHAIEVRLYAEDPDQGFIPQPGPLPFLRFPYWTGVRVDSAVQSPTQISSFYDPMIAKISAWAPDRAQCLKRMELFLEKTAVEGLTTNRSFLLQIMRSSFMKAGRYHTQVLETPDWRQSTPPTAREVALLCLKDHLERAWIPASQQLSGWQRGDTDALEA